MIATCLLQIRREPNDWRAETPFHAPEIERYECRISQDLDSGLMVRMTKGICEARRDA